MPLFPLKFSKSVLSHRAEIKFLPKFCKQRRQRRLEDMMTQAIITRLQIYNASIGTSSAKLKGKGEPRIGVKKGPLEVSTDDGYHVDGRDCGVAGWTRRRRLRTVWEINTISTP
jgi:hypothetical protein